MSFVDGKPRVAASPRLCVVIPAHNEELLVGRCVQSVLDAGVAPQDIYVVDDCSSDGTAAAVGAFDGVQLLMNAVNLGKLKGLRRAVDHFDLVERYDYLSLLDADSHVAPDYFVEVCARFSADERTALVCGSPYSERHNWLTAYRALEYAITLFAYRQGQDRMGTITVAPGCASTYATRILNDLDWDGETLVEDMDLTIQIHRKRLGQIAYAPHAIAHTQDPQRIREYVGQLTRWYSGTWQVMRLRRLPFGGQRIDAEFALLVGEGLFYAVAMLFLPLALWKWPAAVMRVALFDQALWFALAAVFAVRLRRADILTSFPTFLLIRVLNCGLLLQTFWLEVIAGRHLRRWFAVQRYTGAITASMQGDSHV